MTEANYWDEPLLRADPLPSCPGFGASFGSVGDLSRLSCWETPSNNLTKVIERINTAGLHWITCDNSTTDNHIFQAASDAGHCRTTYNHDDQDYTAEARETHLAWMGSQHLFGTFQGRVSLWSNLNLEPTDCDRKLSLLMEQGHHPHISFISLPNPTNDSLNVHSFV